MAWVGCVGIITKSTRHACHLPTKLTEACLVDVGASTHCQLPCREIGNVTDLYKLSTPIIFLTPFPYMEENFEDDYQAY